MKRRLICLALLALCGCHQQAIGDRERGLTFTYFDRAGTGFESHDELPLAERAGDAAIEAYLGTVEETELTEENG